MENVWTHTPRATARAGLALPGLALLAACGGGGGGTAPGGGGGGGGGSDLPDLVPELVAFDPPQADAGTNLSVSDTLANTGSHVASSARLGLYVSTDATITTADRLLGFRTVATLAAGARSSAGGNWTLPVDLAAGTYWIGAIADDLGAIAERSETNNARAAATALVVRAAQLPNLAPVSISASPASVLAGGTLDVSDTVRNGGVVAAGAFQVAIYLSRDATLDAQDVLLGVRAVAGLAPGASTSAGGALVVPPAIGAGTWWCGMLVDAQGEVAEVSELDNALVAGTAIQITVPPRPNLVVQAFSFTPSTVDSGLSITVQDTVANVGPGAAAGFDVEVFLSPDASVTRTDVSLGFRSIAALAPGATNTAQGDLVVPVETPAGDYYVGAIADSGLDAPEESEADNTLVATGTLHVTVPPRPDFVPQSLTFTPSTADTTLGTTIAVSGGLTNLGVMPAVPSRVGVYLSSNNVISTSDVLLGSQDVGALAVGASASLSISATVPAGVSAGTYYLGLFVDDQASQLELSEANNALLAPGTLDVIASPEPAPDLVVQAASYTPHTALPGAPVQVVNEVRNLGTLSASSFQVGIYLSTDDVITTDDVRIGSRTVFQLGIGFGSAASAPYVVPSTLSPGTYHLGVIADDLAQVAESTETNNSLRASGTLVVTAPPVPAPDLLVVSTAFTPASAAPGQPLQLSATVRNGGDLAAGAFRVALYASTDADVDAQDVLLGFLALDTLGPNQDFVGTFGSIVPAALAPGDYTVGAIVDDALLVTESDETNNRLLAAGVLHVP